MTFWETYVEPEPLKYIYTTNPKKCESCRWWQRTWWGINILGADVYYCKLEYKGHPCNFTLRSALKQERDS